MGFSYKKNRSWTEGLHIITQIGLTMAGCIIFCFFVGRFLDRWLETKGIFMTIFTLLGIVGGGNVVYRQIMELVEADKKGKNGSDNGSA
jgi:ATP synthase protein I